MSQAWQQISPLLEPIQLVNTDEVLNSQLWWTNHFVTSNFGITERRARYLASCGLQSLRELCKDRSLILRPWVTVQIRYRRLATKHVLIEHYHNNVPPAWSDIFHQGASQIVDLEWLDNFHGQPLEVSILIIQATKNFLPSILAGVSAIVISTKYPKYHIDTRSGLLLPVHSSPIEDQVIRYHLLWIRAITIPCHPQQCAAFRQYYLASLGSTVQDSVWLWLIELAWWQSVLLIHSKKGKTHASSTNSRVLDLSREINMYFADYIHPGMERCVDKRSSMRLSYEVYYSK